MSGSTHQDSKIRSLLHTYIRETTQITVINPTSLFSIFTFFYDLLSLGCSRVWKSSYIPPWSPLTRWFKRTRYVIIPFSICDLYQLQYSFLFQSVRYILCSTLYRVISKSRSSHNYTWSTSTGSKLDFLYNINPF